jgi:hypothetical protein
MKAIAKSYGFLLALGLGGVLLVLAATARYGTGLTPDSGCYLSVARSLAAGRGYLPYSGNPFVEWPPLFPTLLAIPTSLGAEPITVARYLNAAVFGLILLVSGVWLRRNLRSRLLIGVGAAALLLAVPVQEVASFAWSEPLFILLALLCLTALQSYRSEGRPRALYAAAAYAALACLTRYIGVALLLAGAALILTRRKENLRSRLSAACSFAVAGGVPVAAWLARNYVVSATWLGARTPASSTALAKNLRYTFDNLSGWFLPEGIPVVGRCLLLVLLALGLAAAVRRCSRQRGQSAPERSAGAAWTVGLFLLCYSGWLVASVSAVELTVLDTRYWSPSYIPLLFLTLLALDVLVGRGTEPEAAPPPTVHASRVTRHGTSDTRRATRDPRLVSALSRLGELVGTSDCDRHTGGAPRLRGLRASQRMPRQRGAPPVFRPVSRTTCLVAVGCAMLLVQPGWNTLRNLRFCREYGYVGDPLLVSDGGENAQTAAAWRDSQMIAYLREHPVSGRLYSNSPVVYYLLSGPSMRLLPLLPERQYRRDYLNPELLDLQDYVRQHGAIHLAWFARSLYEVYSLEELQSFFDVQLVTRQRDGSVYRLAPRAEQIGRGGRGGDAPG